MEPFSQLLIRLKINCGRLILPCVLEVFSPLIFFPFIWRIFYWSEQQQTKKKHPLVWNNKPWSGVAYSREPEVTETVPLSFRGSQGGWPQWQETADHLNCPVGKPAADWRGTNRWREGEGTVVGHWSRHPSRQVSHMGFTELRGGGTDGEIERGREGIESYRRSERRCQRCVVQGWCGNVLFALCIRPDKQSASICSLIPKNIRAVSLCRSAAENSSHTYVVYSLFSCVVSGRNVLKAPTGFKPF